MQRSINQRTGRILEITGLALVITALTGALLLTTGIALATDSAHNPENVIVCQDRTAV